MFAEVTPPDVYELPPLPAVLEDPRCLTPGERRPEERRHARVRVSRGIPGPYTL